MSKNAMDAARRFAVETWGETWTDAEMGALLEFAALVTPQATAEPVALLTIVGWAYEFRGEHHLNKNQPRPHPLVRNVRGLGYLDAQPAERDESGGGRDAP